jgi:chemotaxis protein MotA
MFGMLGTVIGLVIMLRSLSDPASIGPAMALALVTTFYGIVIAGIICLPLAGKIRNYIERAALNKTLIIEGLISIQAGDNSQIVKEKLKAYLIKR